MRAEYISPYVWVGLYGLKNNYIGKADISHTEIMEAVADEFKVPIEAYKSDCRKTEILEPRHMAIYLIRTIAKYSLLELARIFEQDHTSIMHVCRVTPRRLVSKDSFKEKYGNIIERLNTISASNIEPFESELKQEDYALDKSN